MLRLGAPLHICMGTCSTCSHWQWLRVQRPLQHAETCINWSVPLQHSVSVLRPLLRSVRRQGREVPHLINHCVVCATL
jgi:hypothetical protein